MCMSSGDTFAGVPVPLLCFFLPNFGIVCDLLLNRRTATWNLCFKYLRRNEARKRENDQIRVNFATNGGRADGDAHGGTSALYTGAPNKNIVQNNLNIVLLNVF